MKLCSLSEDGCNATLESVMLKKLVSMLRKATMWFAKSSTVLWTEDE